MGLYELKEKSIFHAFNGSNLNLSEKIINIMDCRNDVLFLWNNATGCLLTQGTRSLNTNHQELHPTEQPEFEVTNILINESGTRAALWSSRGVVVMDLPWRCGPRMEYQDGKSQIITRCRKVGDLDIGFGAEVVQVRWNNSSVNDSVLEILVSDNSLYHYDMMPSECYNIETVRLGARPISRYRTLAVLGETAVDFCFAPVFMESEPKSAGFSTLLVLRGNGEVILVYSGASEEKIHPEIQLLPISPLPDDHYLSEACAILAITGKPGGVVIGTTRGVLYHALLVPLDVEQLEVPTRMRKYRLLLVESIVLDLGLLRVSDDLGASSLRLMADPSHPRRYLVIHSSGVHSVFMEILTGIKELLRNSAHEPSTRKLPQSTVENLICSGRPILGCTAFPYNLIAIDYDNNVIALPLRRIELMPFKLFTPDEDDQSVQGPLNRQMNQPFQQGIEQLLQESRVLPHVQLPKEDLPREQLLALVVRMSDLVRKVTVPRFRQVRSILTHRMQLIHCMRALQIQEVARLKADRDAIQSVAEAFAERLQLVSEDLEKQREMVQRIVRLVAEANPMPTDAELRMQTTVFEVEAKVPNFESSLEKLKKGHAYQETKIDHFTEKRDVALSSKQAATIRSSLSIIGENIAHLVRRVNEINDILGLNND